MGKNRRARARRAAHRTLFAVVLLAAGAAEAQQPPPSADPGQIQRRFEEKAQPKSLPGAFVPAPAQAPPPAEAASIRFVLVGVALNGNTVFTRQELRPLYEEMLGREVTLAEVYALRDALTAKFRNAGYVLAQAVIPEQRIEGGIVSIEIVEGVINAVRLHGAPKDRLGLLEAYAAKIRETHPLTAAHLERYVLLMDDLPGIAVRAALGPSPGQIVGADLDLFIDEEPYVASLGFDNRGSEEVGPGSFDGRVSAANLYGWHDQTLVRGALAVDTEELRYMEFVHALPVSSEGALLSLGYTRAWSRPGGAIKPLDIESNGQTVRLAVAQPIWRARSRSLQLQADFKAKGSDVEVFGTPLTKDRVRVLSLGLAYDVADRWQGRNLLSVAVGQGLDVMGATETGSPGLSRAGGHSDFTRFNASLRREQRLTDRVDVALSLEGQWSDDELLSSEELGVGGNPYGRAFDASAVTGDRGFVGGIEATLRLPFARSWLREPAVFATADGGSVRNYEIGPRGGEQSLVSLGGGVKFQLAGVAVGLELDKPVREDSGNASDYGWRGFFSASVRY